MSGLTVPETKAGSRPAGGYPITHRTIASHPLAIGTTAKAPQLKLGKRTNSQLFRGKRSSVSRGTILRRPIARATSGRARVII